MRSVGVAQVLREAFALHLESARRSSVLPPREEMPMFIRGLHDGLEGIQNSPEFERPDLSGCEELAVFSDFSARSKGWRTYSFLCCTAEDANAFGARITLLRQDLAVDGRRFEYKSLKDRKRWPAIQAWLSAFDELPGVAFTLLVHPRVLSAFHANAPGESKELLALAKELGLGDWSLTGSGDRILEEAFRIVHSVAFWHAVLTKGRAPLHWYCDNDEILAGPIRREAVERMLPMVVEKYCRRPVRSRITTENELGGSPLRDLLSIPDLLSAGVLEYQRGVEIGAPDMIAKAAVVCEWLSDVKALRKICLQITPMDDGGVWWKLYRPYFSPSPKPVDSGLNEVSSSIG